MTRLFLTFFLLVASSARAAEDMHEFEMIQMSLGANATYSQAFFMDKKTGDIWEYISQPSMGEYKAVKGIKYLGKLRVGEPNEAIIGNYGK